MRSSLGFMADEKTAPFEETKWWIDRGPVKEREKRLRRSRASLRNGLTSCSRDTIKTRRPKTSSICPRILKNSRLLQGNGDTFLSKWAPIPLKGSQNQERSFSAARCSRLNRRCRLFRKSCDHSRTPGERYVDINFTDAPSLDFWVGGQLVEEIFSRISVRRLNGSAPILPGI